MFRIHRPQPINGVTSVVAAQLSVKQLDRVRFPVSPHKYGMKLTLGPPSISAEFDFSISEAVNEVAVYLSGGLDSAALLCLILTELRDTQRLTTVSVKCLTVTKDDGSMDYAAGVVKAISKLFEKDIEHINNIPNDADSILKGRVGLATVQELWKTKSANTVLYMAVNRMAPDDIRPFKQTLKIVYIDSPYYQAPFIDLHKPQILDLFYKLNCEEIIPITHTCTVIPTGVCEQCYSCQERKWGFSSLKKIDPAIGS